MEEASAIKKIAIIGGGPSGLFVYKQLVDTGSDEMHIAIFERKGQLGAGMPYSAEGANKEHITNVSDHEIPTLVTSLSEWIQTAPIALLQKFDLHPTLFNERKVVPRLLFGHYLEAQFQIVQQKAKKRGVATQVFLHTAIADIEDDAINKKIKLFTTDNQCHVFDVAIICTGHNWPKTHEGKVHLWFDSPYPPSKLAFKTNFSVAIKGASLTAIDAVRTLARQNGTFIKKEGGSLTYRVHKDCSDFRVVLHSIDGLLPSLRFHLQHPQQTPGTVLSEKEIIKIKKENDGFIPLDYLFERNFKQPLRKQQPAFYEKIKGMNIEEFVALVISLRERMDAFDLLKVEYAEAEKSIRQKESVYWKEELAALSYAMNFPAKHLSAEDMLRLKKVLMPLIAIVIAFVPQSACLELLALHEAGIIDLIAVDENSQAEPIPSGGVRYNYTTEEGLQKTVNYPMFINAVGQPHFMFEDFPFASLRLTGTVSQALLKFKSPLAGCSEKDRGNKQVKKDAFGNYYLKVPGININDHFQVLDAYGASNDRLYIMATPYIGGLNPDYSGLDFCEAAAGRIVKALLTSFKENIPA